jgi:hypothetical protein
VGKKTCRIIFPLQRFNKLHTETKQGGCKRSPVIFVGFFVFLARFQGHQSSVVQWESGVTRADQMERLVTLWGPIWAVLARERMKDEKSISAKKAFFCLLEPDLKLDVAFVQN